MMKALSSSFLQAKNGQFQTCLRGFDVLLVKLSEYLSELVGDEEPAADLVRPDFRVLKDIIYQRWAKIYTFSEVFCQLYFFRVGILYQQGADTCNQFYVFNLKMKVEKFLFQFQVENLTVTVSKLHRQSVELSNIYSSKAVDENNLPTVSRQLINTNQVSKSLTMWLFLKDRSFYYKFDVFMVKRPSFFIQSP